MKLDDFLDRLKNLPESSHINSVIEKVEEPQHQDLTRKFLISTNIQGNQEIDVKEITATTREKYSNQRWIDFFFDDSQGRGERIQKNLKELFENSYYYESDEEKHSLEFGRVNQESYFILCGHHRSHIARGLDAVSEFNGILRGVTVINYQIDEELKNQYLKLRNYIRENNLPYHLFAKSEINPNENNKYRPFIELAHKDSSNNQIFYKPAQVEEFIENSRKSSLKKFITKFI